MWQGMVDSGRGLAPIVLFWALLSTLSVAASRHSPEVEPSDWVPQRKCRAKSRERGAWWSECYSWSPQSPPAELQSGHLLSHIIIITLTSSISNPTDCKPDRNFFLHSLNRCFFFPNFLLEELSYYKIYPHPEIKANELKLEIYMCYFTWKPERQQQLPVLFPPVPDDFLVKETTINIFLF